MAAIEKIFLKSDNEIKFVGLQDEDGAYINAGCTITMSVFKQVALTIDACRLAFTGGGTATPLVGDAIVGATDGAWAKITAVVKTSGEWADGNVVGYFELLGVQGLFKAAGENLNIVGGQANIATIASASTGAITANAGSKTEILVAAHGLFTYENFCFVEGTQNYDGQQDISVYSNNSITIDAAYAAEKFVGDEKIYVGIVGGKDISITYEAASDGVWSGFIPDTIKGLVEGDYIYALVTIVKGTSTVVVKITLRVPYKTEEDVETS